MGRKRLYTDEERKQKNRESQAKWRAEHKKEDAERKAKWREENLDYYKEYQAEYRKTPMCRAARLVNAYKILDKKYNRGECTLTAKWLVDNIFSKPCNYCGKEGWKIMGCDRIDNSLPHTPDNVVPCCKDCNLKRGAKTYEEFMEETMYKR